MMYGKVLWYNALFDVYLPNGDVSISLLVAGQDNVYCVDNVTLYTPDTGDYVRLAIVRSGINYQALTIANSIDTTVAGYAQYPVYLMPNDALLIYNTQITTPDVYPVTLHYRSYVLGRGD